MTDADVQKTRDTHRDLTILAWIVVGILGLNVSYFVGEEVGSMWYTSKGDWLSIFNAWWIGIIKAMAVVGTPSARGRDETSSPLAKAMA